MAGGVRSIDPEEALNIATDLHNRGHLERAEALYRQLVNIQYRVGKVQNLLGVLFSQTGRTTEAVNAFNQSLSADLPDPQNFLNFAAALYRQNEVSKALDVIARGIRNLPESVDLKLRCATYLGELGRHKESIEFLTDVTILDPNNALAHSALAEAHFFVQSIDKAVSAGKRALEISDRDSISNRTENLLDGPQFATTPTAELLRIENTRNALNVISFSLWGSKEFYTLGAVRNAELASIFYPDWVCRFYCAESVPIQIRERLISLGCEVYLMRETQGSRGALWRFLAADDPSALRFICRDCDSRLNGREAEVVAAWIRSGKKFHVMRDAIVHTALILAGMWGGICGELQNLGQLMQSFSADADKFADQRFLAQRIWPRIRSDVLIHDSYYHYLGEDFPAGTSLSGSNHVGAGIPISFDPPQSGSLPQTG